MFSNILPRGLPEDADRESLLHACLRNTHYWLLVLRAWVETLAGQGHVLHHLLVLDETVHFAAVVVLLLSCHGVMSLLALQPRGRLGRVMT